MIPYAFLCKLEKQKTSQFSVDYCPDWKLTFRIINEKCIKMLLYRELLLKSIIFQVVVSYDIIHHVQNDYITLSIKSIVKEYFSTEACNVEIVNHARNCPELNDVADNVIKNINTLVSVRLNTKNIEPLNEEKRKFVIIFLESEKTFMDFAENLNRRNFHSECFFLVYASYIKTIDEVRKIFKDKIFSKIKSYNFYILFDKQNIHLMCPSYENQFRETKVRSLNEFSKKLLRWKTSKFSFDRFRNFDGITVPVLSNINKPAVYIKGNDTNNIVLGGFEVELIKTLSVLMNFTPKFHVFGLRNTGYTFNITFFTIAIGFPPSFMMLPDAKRSQGYANTYLGFVIPNGI